MTAPTEEPLTWQILQYIGGLLAPISVDNGFYNNVSVIWDNRALSNDDFVSDTDGNTTAFVRVIEVTNAVPRFGSETQDSAGNVAIECYIPASQATAQINAHRLRADIVRCLPGQAGFELGGIKGLTGLKPESKNILQRPAGVPYIVVQILLTADYTEPTARLPR